MIDFKAIFQKGNTLVKLIFINLAVFLVLKVISIVFMLFNVRFDMVRLLAMPSDIMSFLFYPWTIITYMFLHQGVFHIFFNMMCLYWFGKIALAFINEKQLLGLYLWGGILAGAFYLLSYNLFPYYESRVADSILLGASGSIMAIMVAAAMLAPNMEVQLVLIGNVKLKYVSFATIAISLLSITGSNAGGELAHLGGALGGYLYITLLRQGRDVSTFFTNIIGSISNLFDKKGKKTSSKTKFHYQAPMNDGDFNRKKAKRSAEVDAILDKIKRSGYESLSAEEKSKLFEK